jgi:hypothetical protein
VANTFLGKPDLALLTLTQLAEHVAAIRDVVDLPLLVDGDTGFGNPVNTHHTVRVLERAGASGIQLEDQTFPKRCGHFDGKDVVPVGEMVQKVRGRGGQPHGPGLPRRRPHRRGGDRGRGIRRRTRQPLPRGGADVAFVEAPGDVAELRFVADHVEGPVLANLVEGGRTPDGASRRAGGDGLRGGAVRQPHPAGRRRRDVARGGDVRGASIWTRDLGRAHRLAAEVRAGVVWVNCFGTLDYGVPFGGFGQSGWGREHGVEGIELFSETKAVVAAL